MHKNIKYNILFRGSMSEPFFKYSSISDKYKYSNIRTKLPSNIICIHIHAISGVQINSDICWENMWYTNGGTIPANILTILQRPNIVIINRSEKRITLF